MDVEKKCVHWKCTCSIRFHYTERTECIFIELMVLKLNSHDSIVTGVWFQVQTLLQQMQDRFQATSDQVLARNILLEIIVLASDEAQASDCSGLQMVCM